MYPFIILDSVEVPGLGQVGGAILHDAVIEAGYAFVA
jgi:hypothetical protein